MGGTIVCIAAVLLGIDARWPPAPDGGLQYVVQIEPQVLEQLASGAIESLESHVPRYLNDVRAYQIVIGTQELAKTARTPNVQSRILAGVDTAWVPQPDGRVECRMWIHADVLEELQQPGKVIEGPIPADVKTLSLFTITVGRKPPAESLPTTNGANPPEPAEVAPTAEVAPRVLPRGDGGTRLHAESATYIEPSETTPNDPSPPKPDSNSTAKEKPVPAATTEWPLSPTVTLFGLFASLAGNIFLFWMLRDYRKHHRTLLGRMGEVGDIVRGCVLELEGLPRDSSTT